MIASLYPGDDIGRMRASCATGGSVRIVEFLAQERLRLQCDPILTILVLVRGVLWLSDFGDHGVAWLLHPLDGKSKMPSVIIVHHGSLCFSLFIPLSTRRKGVACLAVKNGRYLTSRGTGIKKGEI